MALSPEAAKSVALEHFSQIGGPDCALQVEGGCWAQDAMGAFLGISKLTLLFGLKGTKEKTK